MIFSLKTKFIFALAVTIAFGGVGLVLILKLKSETEKRLNSEMQMALENGKKFILEEFERQEQLWFEELDNSFKSESLPPKLPEHILGTFVFNFNQPKLKSYRTFFYETAADSLWPPFYKSSVPEREKNLLETEITKYQKSGQIANQKKLQNLIKESESPLTRLKARHLLGVAAQRRSDWKQATDYFNVDLEKNAAKTREDDFLKATCFLERTRCFFFLGQYQNCAEQVDFFPEALLSPALAELSEDSQNYFFKELKKLSANPELDSLNYYFQASEEAFLAQKNFDALLSEISQQKDEWLHLLSLQNGSRAVFTTGEQSVILSLENNNLNGFGWQSFDSQQPIRGFIYDEEILLTKFLPEILAQFSMEIELIKGEPRKTPFLSLENGFPDFYLQPNKEHWQLKFTSNNYQINLTVGVFSLLLISSILATAVLFRSIQKEKELLRTQAEFIDAVSHDLKTPLTLLKASAETLHLGNVSQEKQPWYFKSMLNEANWLAALVENILDFSRLRRGKRRFQFEAFPLKMVLDEVLKIIQKQNPERKFEIGLNPGDCKVYSDRTALRQILFNLLDNAQKFSPETEPITIHIQENQLEILIEIIDRGPGIPKEEQGFIFDDFRQGSLAKKSGNRGSGLGLALVRRLVQGLKGEVGYRTNPAGGSVFWVKINTESDA